MPISVTMPRLSDTMQQGTVVTWNVKEGQKVKSGDVIADIETDKATMELQSFDDGVVAKLSVGEGQTVPVGTTILVLAGAGEDAAVVKASGGAGKAAHAGAAGSPSAGTAVATPSVLPATGASTNGHAHANDRVFASPLAKKIAEDAGLDLGAIQGSGPGGRIIRKDVEDVIRGGGAARGEPAAAPTLPGPALAPRAVAPGLPLAGATLVAKVIPLSSMRTTIARRLVESKTTVPHYQVSVDVDMDALVSLREQLNDQLGGQGVKLSVNDFLVRACALAMHQHPYVNSRWVEKGPGIELVAQVNVGIAISLPEDKGGGLVVATIRSADQIGMRQISAESKSLAEKARTKGLTIQEMGDATFTISNLGMFGVSHFTAIINPPNAAILAVGAAIQRPVVRDGQVVPGWVMTMTMSSDHRIVDGAMAARYLATVKGYLERPAGLLV